MIWLREEAKTADEVLGNVCSGIGRPGSLVSDAKDILTEQLAKGPRPQQEIMAMMKAAGIGETTAKKAKALLAIRSVKQGSMWFWSLPEAGIGIEN